MLKFRQKKARRGAANALAGKMRRNDMIKLNEKGAYLVDGLKLAAEETLPADKKAAAANATMAWGILSAHNHSGNDQALQIKFDAMASHDITYVGIVQTARASGLEKFPLPYVLTNCHNSLCAVGGTINEDDHLFGLSAAQKYGGEYVPAHQAVIHQYMRECHAGCGKMILGSDSHTRYGALGTMAIGEGGPELVKQLLGRTYDIARPAVVGVYLTGSPRPGVGPQDVALALIGATFAKGFVKNCVLEFVGPGIQNLSVEYRCGIDVMTTETTCLSSIWATDSRVEEYLTLHGRGGDYKPMAPGALAWYDKIVEIDLDKVEPMIALPFHPSNTFTVEQLCQEPGDILRMVELAGRDQMNNPGFTLTDKVKNGKLYVDQGVIAGCAGGTFENICAAADILKNGSIGAEAFALSVYPSSQPVFLELMKNDRLAWLMQAGATVRTAFCGPCFGAGDVPANNGLSIRHSTRNFPNREGSNPSGGQIASVALMDARSIAATAANGGVLTPATRWQGQFSQPKYYFDSSVYANRVYHGVGKAQPETELRFGPNIADWPAMQPLPQHLMLKVCSYITDAVTTTDELIPSGETSSYRSNPMKLAEFTLSRKDPAYVAKAKAVAELEKARLQGADLATLGEGLDKAVAAAKAIAQDICSQNCGVGSLVYANKPGDGSAREQAASCQKVLGGWANIAGEYATKRYRSNLINWGMLPFLCQQPEKIANGDWIFVPNLQAAVAQKAETIAAYVIKDGETAEITLRLGDLTDDERRIILAGCLINFYRDNN